MVELVDAHGGNAEAGWWDRIHPSSLGWVAARDADGHLVGFVNLVSDGGDHAFLLDTKTHGAHQRKRIGARLPLSEIEASPQVPATSAASCFGTKSALGTISGATVT